MTKKQLPLHIRLKKLREAAGLKAVDVANSLKVHPSAVCRWELPKGDPQACGPARRLLLPLAALYGCEVTELL